MKFKFKYALLSLALLTGCSSSEPEILLDKIVDQNEELQVEQDEEVEKGKKTSNETPSNETLENNKNLSEVYEKPDTTNHKLIKVDGGDTSGEFVKYT